MTDQYNVKHKIKFKTWFDYSTIREFELKKKMEKNIKLKN